jgi:hypothetical protein
VALEYTVKDSPKVCSSVTNRGALHFRMLKRRRKDTLSSAVQTLPSRRDGQHVHTWNCIRPKLWCIVRQVNEETAEHSRFACTHSFLDTVGPNNPPAN